ICSSSSYGMARKFLSSVDMHLLVGRAKPAGILGFKHRATGYRAGSNRANGHHEKYESLLFQICHAPSRTLSQVSSQLFAASPDINLTFIALIGFISQQKLRCRTWKICVGPVLAGPLRSTCWHRKRTVIRCTHQGRIGEMKRWIVSIRDSCLFLHV